MSATPFGESDTQLTSLTIGDLTMDPSRYEEDTSVFGKRSIVASVVLDEDDARRLRSLLATQKPLDVVRHGISEPPVVLTPGHMVHSRNEGGGIKTRFALVEPGQDDGLSRFEIFATTLGNAMDLLADERRRSNELLGLLVTKGVLSEDEAAGIAARDAASEADIRYALTEVADADDGWL